MRYQVLTIQAEWRDRRFSMEEFAVAKPATI